MAHTPKMVKSTRGSGSVAADPVCARLRELFEAVAAQPLPDRLDQLAADLDRAHLDRCGAPQKPGSGR